MITPSDIHQLINSWQERLDSTIQPSPYIDALSECIYDLNQLICHSLQEELTYQDFLEMEADSYLSSMEAHEQAA